MAEDEEYTFDEDAARRIVKATLAQETAARERERLRRARGGPPNKMRLVEFTEDLEPEGQAKAKMLVRTGPGVWASAEPEVELTVEDALGDRAKAGQRAWVKFYGGFWYIDRLRPGECVSTLEGVPVDQYDGFADGATNIPIIGPGGCWEFVQPNTEDCPEEEA